MNRLLELKDPQLCLMLLRSCEGMPKLVYCWRTIPPEFLHECSARFHDNIKDALRQIIVGDGPHFGEFQTHLSSLPVSLGGLGIHSPSSVVVFYVSPAELRGNSGVSMPRRHVLRKRAYVYT